MSKLLDFKDLLDGSKAAREVSGPQDLTVWGGEFSSSELPRFLDAWDFWKSDQVWKLWLWAHQIHLEIEPDLPVTADELERVRCFGEPGDLEVRRDGLRCLWRFVGDPSAAEKPTGFDPPLDYWTRSTGPSAGPLREFRRSVLLWGLRTPAGRWWEDRVAAADLSYPGVDGERIVLQYREYLDGGTVELVRFERLAPQGDEYAQG